MGWDTRLAWAGEQPASGNVLLQRFDHISGTGPDRTLADAAAPGVTWTARNYSAASASLQQGRWGKHLRCNLNAPATEQTSLLVPHFPGLWPASGKMLFTVWAALTFSMNHSPILSTRNDASRHPLVYLATLNNGNPRVIMYSSTGQALIDRSETPPWTPTPGEWVCYLLLVDLDANTVQLGLVHRDTRRTYVAPVRPFTGEPNRACVADLAGLTLSPRHAFWAGGHVDEIAYSRPAEASMPDLVAQVRNSLWARGADSVDGAGLTVTDTSVTASSPAVLHTGAEAVSWATRPTILTSNPISGTPLALTSTDDGASWSQPTPPSQLPTPFTGLLRWHIPLNPGEQFSGIRLEEQPPPPSLAPVAPITLTQHAAATITLTGTWTGTPTIQVTASPGIAVTAEGLDVHIHTGLSLGEFSITATLTDETGQASSPLTILVTVEALPWEPADNPIFARAPLVVYDASEHPSALIHDPRTATLLREINGEETLTFSLPASHPKAATIAPERIVEAAGQRYRIRRITHTRSDGVPTVTVYCEAAWYDLRVAGHVLAQEWKGTQAGPELEHILKGTGWTVGAVTVGTRRSWTMEKGTTLACLRAVQQVHGGDLVFNSEAKTVSLLTFSGRDRGVAFFHGRGLTSATRIEDTTTLITRIEPRNAEGVGIETVNGGVPYLEDRSYINEIRHGVYQFASGTSPLTMLTMTAVSLAKRARPSVSYQATIADLSAWSGQEADRFDCGDRVLVADEELGINSVQRIVALEYDLLQPWASKATLSEKLRELGDTTQAVDAGVLTTGTDIDTRDLVPFNLLQNSRFDNGLAHWAAAGASVVEGGVTGTKAVELAGAGYRWIEQTIVPDTREVYTVSFQLSASGFPAGSGPTVEVLAEVIYSDGTSETITQKVT